MAGKSKRSRYKFTEKKHSRCGIMALLLSILLMGLYISIILYSFVQQGNVSMYIGSVGVVAMLLSVTGFGLSIKSCREEESYPLFPRLSLVWSMCSLLLWFGTYMFGWLTG